MVALTIAYAAPRATVAHGLGVSQRVADLLGGTPEVIHRPLLDAENVAGRDQSLVNTHALPTVRQVQGVIEGGLRLVVGKAVQVPVRMTAEHDGGLLGSRESHHLEIPRVILDGVGDVRDDLAGEALLSVGIDDGKRDAVVRVRDDGEVSEVPAIGAAMQGLGTIGRRRSGNLVRCDVISLPVNLEGAVPDAIRIATRHAAKVRVLPIDPIVAGVIEASYDVSLDSILVIDEQPRDRGAVWDKSGRQTLAVDPV